MNGKALVAIWMHLKDVDGEVLDAMDTIQANGGTLLPANVQAFAKEIEVGLKAFLALDPLIQILQNLLPTGTTLAPT